MRDAALCVLSGLKTRHELPPVNHFDARKVRRSPLISSEADIDAWSKPPFGFDPKAACAHGPMRH
jgi:hypothetical protein